MPSVAYKKSVDRCYLPLLDRLATAIAERLRVDLTVTTGRDLELTADCAEVQHRVGRALDFQVHGYAPLGALPLERLFGRILALHDELFAEFIREHPRFQLMFHPGGLAVSAHIHLGLPAAA